MINWIDLHTPESRRLCMGDGATRAHGRCCQLLPPWYLAYQVYDAAAVLLAVLCSAWSSGAWHNDFVWMATILLSPLRCYILSSEDVDQPYNMAGVLSLIKFSLPKIHNIRRFGNIRLIFEKEVQNWRWRGNLNWCHKQKFTKRQTLMTAYLTFGVIFEKYFPEIIYTQTP